MKHLLIIANWKENKTIDESMQFMDEFSKLYSPREEAEVIICPPFTSLSALFQYILENSTKVSLGAQNISSYEEGAHTGEIAADQVKGLAKYVILGHSERRAMGETNELIEKKLLNASGVGLMPILCVQDENTHIPMGTMIVAYEPVAAIGTGNPDTPENADQVAGKIKGRNQSVKHVLYGGSVIPENVNTFTSKQNISGVLVGGASLDAQKFSQIIKNA